MNKTIRDLVAKFGKLPVPIDQVADDADLYAAGLTSFASVQLMLGIEEAFDELGLEKVWAEVLADNDAALRAQAAAGFRREGYLRRHALKDGQFQDVVLLAILAEEWRARREAVRRDLAGSHLIAA